MTVQPGLWTAAGAAALVALVAGFAEHARSRRRNLDRVGWMPWQAIMVVAFFLAIGLAALAARS